VRDPAESGVCVLLDFVESQDDELERAVDGHGAVVTRKDDLMIVHVSFRVEAKDAIKLDKEFHFALGKGLLGFESFYGGGEVGDLFFKRCDAVVGGHGCYRCRQG